METKLTQPIEFAAEVSTPDIEHDISTLASGAGITLFGKVSGRGIDALTEILLARWLGPTAFGLYAIGMTVLRIVGTIGAFGLNNGVIQFGARYWRTSPHLKSTLVYAIGFSLVSGTVIGTIVFFGSRTCRKYIQ
jgi:O-antigen/teichoic acid export membrane protein